MFRVWFSTESFADYIIDNTILSNYDVSKKKMYESDANNPTNFHTLPDHIKKILYLDAPDLIVEYNSEPIFSIEISSEAGTGHNAFQRFARIAASVENGVPAIYIYPKGAIITRQDSEPTWDVLNPLIFKALESVMNIYNIPALLHYFPTDYDFFPAASASPNLNTKGLLYETNPNYLGCPKIDTEDMQKLFSNLNEIINCVNEHGTIDFRGRLLGLLPIREQREYMNTQFVERGGEFNQVMSPLTATKKIPTEYLLNYLSQYENRNYNIGEILRSRNETIVYMVDAKFRSDPYPGALSAIDYLCCREGKTFEERRYNLVLLWGRLEVDDENRTISVNTEKQISINDFVTAVKQSENKNLLTKTYDELSSQDIPRYYMQVRYGSTYSKSKHIRVYSYFADAIIFPDGALWRDN